MGHGSRGMGLTTLISGYITSDFSTVLPVPMVAVILAPTIVPVGFSVATTPFVLLMEPLPHSNTTSKNSQSLASLTASEHPLAPESLFYSTAPVCPLARNI